MPARHIRGLGVAVVLVLCWLAWYNYEILLGESNLRLSWPLVRVEETQDAVGHGVGEDVFPPAKLEVSTATVMPTSTSTSLSPPEPTHSEGTAEGHSPDVVQGSQDGGKDSHILSPDEVLLIFKTGASTIWRRMPLHVTTTLSSTHFPNFVIYSDLAEDLSPSIHAIDALENVTSIIKAHDPDAYASYLEQQSPDHLNTYREHGRLPGDEPPDAKAGNTPGWLLDKYKFLPMLGHAAKEYPGMKWYIYIEDDTYLFLPTLLTWLSTQSHNSTPKYFGAYSGEGNDTFAQGGSGLVFSQSLMKTVFGGDKAANLEEYGNYTSKSCCGDVALGKVLRDYDIYVNEGDYGPVSFRPEPPWRTGFSELIWCSPVFTFHHLHQRDIAVLAGFEEEKRKENASRPLLFRDIFTRLIRPHISAKPRNGWDNFATLYTLTSPSPSSANPPAIPTIPPMLLSSLSPTPPTNLTRLQQAPSSPSSCQSACLSLPSCLSWRHETVAAKTETEDENGVPKTPVTRPEERTCVLDNSVRLGREMDPQASWERKKEVVSGWAMERIEGMARDECVNVGNVVV